jgi:hypothetical protein
MRIELISSEPESGILSIELRVRCFNERAKVQNIFSFS